MATTETILKHEEVITSASAEKSDSPADFPAEKPVSPDDLAAAIIEAQPKQTWRSHIWDTLDKSPEERRFLFKFDAIVLTFASLGFFIKILDQYNINTAFISGMQKDLNLVGNELNYMSSVYTAGYTLGMIPSNFLLTKIRPSIWIPTCEVVWSVLTILLAKCQTPQHIYAVRFFVGLTEASFYPGLQFLIGSWYRSDELAKRSCIFHASGNLAAMVSGYLMTGIFRLEGVHGFHAWQWLFIINTVFSLPIAIAGYFFIPDVPETTKAWYLTENEIALAKRRMLLEGRAPRQPYTKAKIKKIFSTWHIYLLSLVYVFYNNSNGYGGIPVFALWLQSKGYNLYDINTYPTIQFAITIVFTIFYAWTSDGLFKGRRWPPIVFVGVINIVFYISLAVWNIPDGWKWTIYILGLFGVGLSGIIHAWVSEICSGDNEERAFAIALLNVEGQVIQTWLPLLMWPVSEAPRSLKGYVACIFIAAAMIVSVFIARHFQKRDLDKGASDEEETSDATAR